MHNAKSASPLISIAMSVLNCRRTIGVTMNSILNQTYENWELVVMDDGSSDGTAQIVQSFGDARVRVFRDGERRRLPARLNQAIQLARGPFIARMDGDDVMYPDRLAKQLAFLQAHPQVDLVGGGMVIFRNDGEAYGTRIFPAEHAEICCKPWLRMQISHPTWMGRAEWFRTHPYPEAYRRYTEDLALLFGSFQRSRFANLPDIVLGYRRDRTRLATCMAARYYMTRMLLGGAGREVTHAQALCGCALQCAAAVVEVVAIGSGLNERILKHRARPLASRLAEQWRSVWAMNQEPAAIARPAAMLEEVTG
jgi:glycosyltransferase involved in cell wall biosynthesis